MGPLRFGERRIQVPGQDARRESVGYDTCHDVGFPVPDQSEEQLLQRIGRRLDVVLHRKVHRQKGAFAGRACLPHHVELFRQCLVVGRLK